MVSRIVLVAVAVTAAFVVAAASNCGGLTSGECRGICTSSGSERSICTADKCTCQTGQVTRAAGPCGGLTRGECAGLCASKRQPTVECLPTKCGCKP